MPTHRPSKPERHERRMAVVERDDDVMEGNAAEAERLVRALSVDIGPRLAGSAGETAAAEWLEAQLRDADFETTIEPFRTPSTFALAYGLLVTLSLLAYGIAFVLPLAAAIVGLVALALLVVENLTIESASRLVPRVTSRNVIARRAARGEPRQTVVVTAHMDSAPAALICHPRLVKAFRAVFVFMVVGMVLIPVVSALRWWGVPHRILYIAAPFAVHLLICLAILAHGHLFARVVHGAEDNASGVAALVLAARSLPPLHATDVWLVGTGAEEAGLVGMLRLLQSHPFDPAITYFLNIDCVASPRLRFNSSEGMLLTKAADPHLIEVARASAEKAGLEAILAPSHVISSDAVAAMMRGCRVMTVTCDATPNWHWLTDVADTVAPEGPAHAAAVITRIIQALDDEQADG